MTASRTTNGETTRPTAENAVRADAPELGDVLRRSAERLIAAATARLVDVAVDKVDDLADRLEAIRRDGGVGLNAAFGAGMAKMAGRSPVWGAIKGAWSALGTGTKVAVVAGLVLLGLLSPVALVVLLVVLLIAAIVRGVRATQ